MEALAGNASPANTETEPGVDVPLTLIQEELPEPEEAELLPVQLKESSAIRSPAAGQRDSPEAADVKTEEADATIEQEVEAQNANAALQVPDSVNNAAEAVLLEDEHKMEAAVQAVEAVEEKQIAPASKPQSEKHPSSLEQTAVIPHEAKQQPASAEEDPLQEGEVAQATEPPTATAEIPQPAKKDLEPAEGAVSQDASAIPAEPPSAVVAELPEGAELPLESQPIDLQAVASPVQGAFLKYPILLF